MEETRELKVRSLDPRDQVRRSGPDIKPAAGMVCSLFSDGGDITLDSFNVMELSKSATWRERGWFIKSTPSPDPGEAPKLATGQRRRGIKPVITQPVYAGPAQERFYGIGLGPILDAQKPVEAAMPSHTCRGLPCGYEYVGQGLPKGFFGDGPLNGPEWVFCSPECRDAKAAEVSPARKKPQPSPWSCSNGKECRTPTAGPFKGRNVIIGIQPAGMCVACADKVVASMTEMHERVAHGPPPRPQPGYTMPGEHAQLALKGGWRRGWR